MKNFNSLFVLLLSAVFLYPPLARAQTGGVAELKTASHYESFNYPAGDLQGQTPLWWELESSLASVKSSREIAGSNVTITTGSLNYPNITSAGNKITVPGDLASYFMRLKIDADESKLYASFILRVTSLPASGADPDPDEGNHFMSFGNNTNSFGLIYIRNSTVAGKFNIGIKKRETQATVWAPDELDLNTNYYIVSGALKGTGSPRGDAASLWINPTATVTAPSISQTTGGDFNNFNGLSWLILHREKDNPRTSASIEIDELRLAITWSEAVTLPVRLGKFSAEAEGNRSKISWNTYSEDNNDYFMVERSADGENFTLLAKMPGKGTTTAPSAYTVYDHNPLNGVNYYRLFQFDRDGQSVNLGVRAVSFKLDDAVLVNVYPNPVESEINLSLQNYQGNFNAILSTMDGRVIHQQTAKAIAGQSVYPIHLAVKPAPGIYVLKVTGDKSLARSVKVIVP